MAIGLNAVTPCFCILSFCPISTSKTLLCRLSLLWLVFAFACSPVHIDARELSQTTRLNNATQFDIIPGRSSLDKRDLPRIRHLFLYSAYTTPEARHRYHLEVEFERRPEAAVPPSSQYESNRRHALIMFDNVYEYALAVREHRMFDAYYDGGWQPQDTARNGFRGRFTYNTPTNRYIAWDVIEVVTRELGNIIRWRNYQPFDGQVNVKIVFEGDEEAGAVLEFWRIRGPSRYVTFDLFGKGIRFFGYHFGKTGGQGYVKLPSDPDELK
ncbi:MAG: hypothetical protein M1817_003710 [Caeruleum heppii]|nr:MAG: hypothetical protein M1817_003710 [Caeruleum heppii]